MTRDLPTTASAMRKASSASAGANSSAQLQRLPVNHRRHKVAPELRKRVSTACNSCNVRRIKCSGESPCAQCRNGSRKCQYPTVIEKISIARSEFEDLQARCRRLEQCLEQAVPDEARRGELISGVASYVSISTSDDSSSTTAESSDGQEDEPAATEGRLLHDPDGTARYLGSTSGATFLDLVKEFMTTLFPLAWAGSQNHPETTFLGSLGRYQTYNSRPLPVHDVDPYYLPMKTEMTMMMAQLRYFLQDGSGDFESGGIYFWGDFDPSFFDSKPLETSPNPPTLRRLALFQAAFAMTCWLETPAEKGSSTQRGEAYFARARLLLGNPLDTTMSSVHDVPVLAMMGVYLVEMDRRDAAYIYVSLGMHIAMMHGVHRGWVHNEQGKRAFWTLYILDRWLSVLLGRPPTIIDDAIRLPLPSEAQGLPMFTGLKAHVELAKISGYIVCNIYRIAPWKHQASSTSARIDNALSRLSSWLSNLPPELQLIDHLLTEDRACCELHMAYNQLLILTVRPIFFVAVKKAVAERFINRSWSLENHPQISHIRQCTDAARCNLKLGRWVRDRTTSRKLLSTSLHNIFNAAIILLLHQLLFDTFNDNDAQDISLAIECFDAEAFGESNYPKDCARCLRDLSTLVQRLRNRNLDEISQLGNSPGTMHQHVQPQPAATTAYDVGFILNPEIPPPSALPSQPLQGPPTSHALYNELSTWIGHDDLLLYNNYLI